MSSKFLTFFPLRDSYVPFCLNLGRLWLLFPKGYGKWGTVTSVDRYRRSHSSFLVLLDTPSWYTVLWGHSLSKPSNHASRNPSHMERLHVGAPGNSHSWASFQVIPVLVSDLWVKKPPDDSNSQEFKSLLAIWVFPTETPDIMKQRQAISAVTRPVLDPWNPWA